MRRIRAAGRFWPGRAGWIESRTEPAMAWTGFWRGWICFGRLDAGAVFFCAVLPGDLAGNSWTGLYSAIARSLNFGLGAGRPSAGRAQPPERTHESDSGGQSAGFNDQRHWRRECFCNGSRAPSLGSRRRRRTIRTRPSTTFTLDPEETNGRRSLELLNQWKEKYPTTDFKAERLALYLVTTRD